jgi:hypothetical protein
MVTQKHQVEGDRRMKLWGKTALISFFLMWLTLSVVFPYGIGFAVFLWALALLGVVCGVGIICYGLLKDLLSGIATFGYKPTTAYMAGKKTKKKEEDESSDEQREDN